MKMLKIKDDIDDDVAKGLHTLSPAVLNCTHHILTYTAIYYPSVYFSSQHMISHIISLVIIVLTFYPLSNQSSGERDPILYYTVH